MKKKIPIGVSDFKKIMQEDYHYIDKSLFIKEIWEDGSEVILLPRPRRFGKTLNMSMLRYFFEKTDEDTSVLFKGLRILEEKEVMQQQRKLPVIYLTFKDIKFNCWEDCLRSFRSTLSYLYSEKKYLLDGDTLDENEKSYFNDVIWKRTNTTDLGDSIRNMCMYLYKYYCVKPIVLIDEYDTPIYSAWGNGYYDNLITFVRNLLGVGLKDNIYLGKAVLTGIMRIAKESIFSGLNNLNVATLLHQEYNDKFGFLEEEVEQFMNNCSIEYEMSEVRDWYNGYVFGGKVIYNPWSIINYAHKYRDGLKPYWVNTGSSDLIRDILRDADGTVKQDMEDLIQGGELVKAVREDTVLHEIRNSSETVWSFLLFSGYLKAVDMWMENKKTMCRLKIPNKEVEYVFEEIIRYWINQGVGGNDYRLMLKSLTTGDIKTFGKIFRATVEKSFSYFDVGGNEPERFYHAFVLGLMVSMSGEYQISSNRESGYGRYDVMMAPLNKQVAGYIFEFKKVDNEDGETLETACEEALRQIEEKQYRSELESLGIDKIIEIGIAFEGKKVMVKDRK